MSDGILERQAAARRLIETNPQHFDFLVKRGCVLAKDTGEICKRRGCNGFDFDDFEFEDFSQFDTNTALMDWQRRENDALQNAVGTHARKRRK